MRIRDWSSDVCSSDLRGSAAPIFAMAQRTDLKFGRARWHRKHFGSGKQRYISGHHGRDCSPSAVADQYPNTRSDDADFQYALCRSIPGTRTLHTADLPGLALVHHANVRDVFAMTPNGQG